MKSKGNLNPSFIAEQLIWRFTPVRILTAKLMYIFNSNVAASDYSLVNISFIVHESFYGSFCPFN